MESRPTKDLALRLLELEQRFEAYCMLHEEELAEIRSVLLQLREDLLKASRDLGTASDLPPLTSLPENGDSRVDTPAYDDLSL